MYSPALKELVGKLLVKDEKKRPHVIDILKMPYVKNFGLRFIQNQGRMQSEFTLTMPRDIQPAAVNKLKQKDESQLTAHDRMKLRKE